MKGEWSEEHSSTYLSFPVYSDPAPGHCSHPTWGPSPSSFPNPRPANLGWGHPRLDWPSVHRPSRTLDTPKVLRSACHMCSNSQKLSTWQAEFWSSLVYTESSRTSGAVARTFHYLDSKKRAKTKNKLYKQISKKTRHGGGGER